VIIILVYSRTVYKAVAVIATTAEAAAVTVVAATAEDIQLRVQIGVISFKS